MMVHTVLFRYVREIFACAAMFAFVYSFSEHIPVLFPYSISINSFFAFVPCLSFLCNSSFSLFCVGLRYYFWFPYHIRRYFSVRKKGGFGLKFVSENPCIHLASTHLMISSCLFWLMQFSFLDYSIFCCFSLCTFTCAGYSSALQSHSLQRVYVHCAECALWMHRLNAIRNFHTYNVVVCHCHVKILKLSFHMNNSSSNITIGIGTNNRWIRVILYIRSYAAFICL